MKHTASTVAKNYLSNTTPFRFYKQSSPAGSGKTTAAIEYASKRAAEGHLFIFAVPSLKKVREVYNAASEHRSTIKKSRDEFHEPFNIEVITSDSHSGIEKALSKTMTHLHEVRRESGQGAIIIVTHEGFLISTEIAQLDKMKRPYHLIWDETTSVIFHVEGNILKEMKTALFDGVLCVSEKNGVYTGEVTEDSIPVLKERLKEQGIGIRDSQEVKTILKHLLNAGQGFCDILLGGNIENQVSMVFIYNHLKFTGYSSVTFLGANLEMTTLYQWFSMKGIEWVEHPEITKMIGPFDAHQFKLNIYYGNTGRDHTRNFLDKTNGDNKTFREVFREKALSIIGENKTLVMKNINDNFFYPHNYDDCPWNMEGLNEFRELTNAIYIGAFNQHPAYYTLIEKLGIVDYTAALHLYQFLMRLACREWDFRGTINLFLPCLNLFEPIKHLFHLGMVACIDMRLGFEEVEDGRLNTNLPTRGWYDVTEKEMKSCGFAQRASKAEYARWFESLGYRRETVEVSYTDSSRRKKVRQHTVVYKTETDLREAKMFLG